MDRLMSHDNHRLSVSSLHPFSSSLPFMKIFRSFSHLTPSFFKPRHAATMTMALLALALSADSRACSVCGCSLSSDWAAQGIATQPGFETGVRFEYFDQTNLRRGTRSADTGSLTLPSEEEIQQRTLNRNTWLDLDYVFNSKWSVSAQLPYYDRFHTTIAEGDTDISTSHAHGLGDLRILGRWRKSGLTHSFSVQFGLKLPTGRFDQNFADGPQAGELLDRGLQLGTGTTDLLAGVSYFSRPATEVGCFTQVVLSQPLASRENFLPSASVGFNTGVRWLNTSRFTPQLQLNVRWESREHGAEADVANSGATLAYLSPGITAEIGRDSTASVFVQLPVYQNVNGLQLEPRWLLSVGLRRRF
jgi:hypothetical protein